MGDLLRLILLIITGTLSLVREIRSLRNQRPFFMAEPGKQSFFLDLVAEASVIHPPSLLQLPPIEEPDPMIEFQIEIEKLFHKNQLFPRIKSEFTNEPAFLKHFKANSIQEEFGFDLLVQMVLHKRAHLPVLVGLLRKHFDGNCQKTADELLKAASCDLVDWEPVSRQFIIRFDITKDVQDDLDRYQYPMPMVVEPQTLRSNRDTGYYTSKNSVILKNNHHDEDVCLDHLNRMNQIRFKLDMDTATTIKNSWKSLDKPKPDEDHKEFQKRVKAFEKIDRTAYDVMMHLGLSSGGEFWFTHKFDKRGRSYCQGYVCNYQGTTWQKACVHFANEELVQ